MYPPIIASISLFPYDFAPRGWTFCNGSLLVLYENEYLFSLLGNNFGGNPDEGTFGVPNLKAPQGCNYCIALEGMMRNETYDGVTGETVISVTDVNPSNLIACTGQSLPLSQYMMLGKYLGSRFGDAGPGQFKMPDLSGQLAAKCSYMMATSGNDPHMGPNNALVGEIILLPFDQTPRNCRPCNGELLPIANNTALFSLIGNKFGGDGKTNFALPNLTKQAPAKFNYYMSMGGTIVPKS